jgi:O-antigen ligase
VLVITLTLLVASTTLAFGAVYPWGYFPLFAVAAFVGLSGILNGRDSTRLPRPITLALLVLVAAVAVQLIPLSATTLDRLSPHTRVLVTEYSLAFAGQSRHPVSINPRVTRVAFIGFASLALYLTGLPRLLTRRDLRGLPRNLMLFAVLLAVIGIYGREHNNGLVYGFWQPLEGTNANGFGPFVNRNHFAGWMLMATCLTLGVLCGRIEMEGSRVKPNLRDRLVWLSTANANRIALTGAAAVAMTIALVWTMSRSGIVALACALACFLWLVFRRRGLARWHRATIVVVLALVVAIAVNWRGVDRIASWFGDTTDLVDRVAAWSDGWQVVRDFPVTGTGMNSYADAMIFYQKHVLQFWMSHAHNDYLQLLAEGGLLVSIPALMVTAALIISIRRSIRCARADAYEYWVRAGAAVGLVAIAIQETVEFSLQIPANALLFATLAAVAMSIPAQPSEDSVRVT